MIIQKQAINGCWKSSCWEYHPKNPEFFRCHIWVLKNPHNPLPFLGSCGAPGWTIGWVELDKNWRCSTKKEIQSNMWNLYIIWVGVYLFYLVGIAMLQYPLSVARWQDRWLSCVRHWYALRQINFWPSPGAHFSAKKQQLMADGLNIACVVILYPLDQCTGAIFSGIHDVQSMVSRWIGRNPRWHRKVPSRHRSGRLLENIPHRSFSVPKSI